MDGAVHEMESSTVLQNNNLGHCRTHTLPQPKCIVKFCDIHVGPADIKTLYDNSVFYVQYDASLHLFAGQGGR